MFSLLRSRSFKIKFRYYFIESFKSLLKGLFIFGPTYHLVERTFLWNDLSIFLSRFRDPALDFLNIVLGFSEGWVLIGILTFIYFHWHSRSRRLVINLIAYLLGMMLWIFIFIEDSLYFQENLFFWYRETEQSKEFLLLLLSGVGLMLSLLLFDILLSVIKKYKIILITLNKDYFLAIKDSFLKGTDWIQEKFYIDGVHSSQIIDLPLENLSEVEEIRRLASDDTLFLNFEKNIDLVHKEIEIYNSVKNRRSSLVMCVDGSWGSGKTSIVQIVKNRFLPKNKRFDLENGLTWLTFKPWGFSNKDELVESFLEEMRRILKVNYGINLGSEFDRYIKMITPMFDQNGAIKNFLKSVELISGFNNKTYGELKESISKKLKNLPGTIVILIDDLDRLSYGELMLILKLVKENMDFSGLVFILPFDYSKVSRLIVEERKGVDYYSDYLQKIISSKVAVNAISYKEMKNLFFKVINEEFESRRLEKKLDGQESLLVFEQYVLEFTRDQFRDMLLSKDGPTITEASPLFQFYSELFNYHKSHIRRSYPDLYESILSDPGEGLRLSISRHSSGEISNLDQLIEYLYRPINKVLRANLLETLKGLAQSLSRPGVAWVTEFSSGLEPIISPYTPRGINRKESLESHINNFWANNSGLVSPNRDEVSKIIDELGRNVEEYINKFESSQLNKKDENFVKSWLSKKITPRDTKLFASFLSLAGDVDWSSLDSRKKIVKSYFENNLTNN